MSDPPDTDPILTPARRHGHACADHAGVLRALGRINRQRRRARRAALARLTADLARRDEMYRQRLGLSPAYPEAPAD